MHNGIRRSYDRATYSLTVRAHAAFHLLHCPAFLQYFPRILLSIQISDPRWQECCPHFLADAGFLRTTAQSFRLFQITSALHLSRWEISDIIIRRHPEHVQADIQYCRVQPLGVDQLCMIPRSCGSLFACRLRSRVIAVHDDPPPFQEMLE